MDGHLPDTRNFWIFGYGSLMWRPGFAFEERQAAWLYGYHRCLCIRSTVYRGTPERPGLVMGLDRGGSVRGIAFRIAPASVKETLAYLDEREQITKVYCPKVFKIRLDDRRVVRAYTFVARHDHEQYAGKLTPDQAACYIAQGHGQMGSSLEYVENTCRHLQQIGISDAALKDVLRRARRRMA